MYGSYVGFYGKKYDVSYNGTFKSRISTAPTFTKRPTTRDHDNQKGLDPSLDAVIPNIHSPAKFTK